jgi:hypothetical protein
MKKNLLSLFFITIIMASCQDEYDDRGNYSFLFKPQKASVAGILPGERHFSFYEGIRYVDYRHFDGDVLTKDAFFLWVSTSNLGSLDNPVATIEQQIELDYKKSQEESKKSGSSSAKAYTNLVEIEYRTTEIKEMVITTLNTPLFGKQAGESLNDFFDIARFDPPVIISAQSKTLIYGYSSSNYPVSIEEWLDLSPLAQANILLVPNSEIQGLPLDVQFVVQMKTAEGIVLSDTTRTITITN